MRPLRDNLFVKIDESLPTEFGILLPVNTDNWRAADDQLGNRGKVIMVGAGRRHPKSACLLKPQCKEGDIVRFSELEYPTVEMYGVKYIVINDQDILGVES